MRGDLLKSGFFKNSIIYTAGTFIGGVFNYLFHFVVSRQLSVAEYGELQGLLSLFMLMSFASASISYFVIKHASAFAADKNYAATKEFISVLSREVSRYAALALVVFLFATPLIARILHLPHFWAVAVIGASAFFGVSMVVYTAALRGWQSFFKASTIGVLSFAGKFVFGVGLAFFVPKASVVALSFLLSAVATYFIARSWGGAEFREWKGGEKGKSWHDYFTKEQLKKSVLPITLFSAFTIALGDIDVLFMKMFTSAEMTGHFGALKTIGKIVLTVNGSIVGVFLSHACIEERNGGGASGKARKDAYWLLVLASAAAILAYAFLPELIVSVLFGEKYLVFADMLWLYAAMAATLSFLMLEANYAYARNDLSILYVLGALIPAIALTTFFFRADLFGLTAGLTAVLLCGYLGILAINLMANKRRIP